MGVETWAVRYEYGMRAWKLSHVLMGTMNPRNHVRAWRQPVPRHRIQLVRTTLTPTQAHLLGTACCASSTHPPPCACNPAPGYVQSGAAHTCTNTQSEVTANTHTCAVGGSLFPSTRLQSPSARRSRAPTTRRNESTHSLEWGAAPTACVHVQGNEGHCDGVAGLHSGGKGRQRPACTGGM